jgi:hypothetical protein
MDEITKQKDWDDAVQRFRYCHDQSAIVDFLRKFHDHYETPDLNFLADLLDGKFKRKKGGQQENKIVAGIKQTQAANTVAALIS